MSESIKNLTILIAEDDDGHAELIEEGLRDSGVMNRMVRFHNGEEIWNYLIRSEMNQDREEHSFLVLLDINMPRMDGVEVLNRMKNNEQLKHIPVMMLTTTDDPREVQRCYKAGCNVYISKPIDFNRFSETLRRVGLFIQIVKAC